MKPYEINNINKVKDLFSPIYYYTDAEAFKLLNKRKASTVAPTLKDVDVDYSYQPTEPTLKRLMSVVELANSKDFKNLSSDASDLLREISYERDRKECAIHVMNDVHNYKTDTLAREKIKKLGLVMKKAGAKSIDALLKSIVERKNNLTSK